MEALEILKAYLWNRENEKILMYPVSKVKEAIEELEELNEKYNQSMNEWESRYHEKVGELYYTNLLLEKYKNRSCENCKSGFDCNIFKKLWKEKLKKDGYLMSRKEFDCRLWESIK